MRTAIDRTVIVRLLAGPPSIRDFANNRTADGTMCADILAARDLRAFGWRLTRLNLSNTSELQHTYAGERAGDKSGVAEKGAPVHPGRPRWFTRRHIARTRL